MQSSAEEAMTKVKACVSYPTHAAGIYEFDLSEYNPTLIKNNIFANGGGINKDGEYFCVRFEVIAGIPAVRQNSYYLSNWEEDADFSGSLKDVATDLAYNYDRDQAFGCYMNDEGTGYNFCSVNLDYFQKVVIAPLPKEWSACDFASDGKLYAIDCDGDVFTVDLGTGALTSVGSTGVASTWITGGFIDKSNDTFYWAVKTDSESALYKTTLPGCTATKVYDLGNEEQLGGFLWNEPVVNPKAPAAPTGTPSLSFSGTSLSGKVAFYPPSRLADGTAVESGTPVDYHILCNGVEKATGTTTFGGSRLNIDVTVDKEDTYCVAVVFSNEAGTSGRAKTTKFIGPDTPKTNTRLQTTWNNGKINLSWYAISSGVNGGSLADGKTYRLIRYENDNTEGTLISDQLSTTSYTDEFPMPTERTRYHYTIETMAGGKISAPFSSAEFALGPLEPAFSATFKSGIDLAQWTVLDIDTKKWEYNSDDGGCVKVTTSTNAASDSWLVTPPVKLIGGCKYDIKVMARSYSSSYEEQFDVMMGAEATAEALTTVILKDQKVCGNEYQPFQGVLEPAESGYYYIGLHATTPTRGGYLYVNLIEVAAPVSSAGPAAVDNFTATAATEGSHNIELSFDVPTTKLDGTALSAVSSIEIRRDGTVIKTISENITPGQTVTYTDEDAPKGEHEYSVVCVAGELPGAMANAKIFVGFHAPNAVSDIKITEDSANPGNVTISWAAPETDVAGIALPSSALKYIVLNKDGQTIATDVETTQYSLQATSNDTQIFARYLIVAVTEGGESEEISSKNCAVGKPYSTPFKESFSNRELSSIWGSAAISGSDYWTMIAADTDYDVYPQDNDNGMAFFEGYNRDIAEFYSGKVDLEGLQSPALTFYVYNFGGSSATQSENTIEVQIRDNSGSFQHVETYIVGETGPINEWNKVIVPLDDYFDQIVCVKFIASVKDMRFFYLDNVNITSIANHNLTITGIEAPDAVEAGKDFDINVSIANNGIEYARGFKVELYKGDTMLQRVNGPELAPEKTATVALTSKLSIFDNDASDFHVVIDYSIDEIESDNTSEPFTVYLKTNQYPSAANLSANVDNLVVTLDWAAPAVSAIPAAETQDFESATAWTSSIEGWKFLDLDQGSMGGIGSKQLPINGRQSFFVMDGSYATFNSNPNFAGHSGNQYLCSMYGTKGSAAVQSDDWVITPELYGGPQTVSFYASSFVSDNAAAGETQYYETFEVLYSTTGNNSEDFILLKRYMDVPATWIKYTAFLPEGAKYFAIRCISYDKYMLFVDDISFMAKGGKAETINLLGYNVYRNQQKLNTEPIAATTFVDTQAQEANTTKFTYHVTAVYSQGETKPGQGIEVDITENGIVNIGSDSAEVEYFNLQGVKIDNPTSGIYIRRQGIDVRKVVVK